MMMNLGAHRRWKRFFGCDNKSIIVPVDHGLGFGPSKGIENTKKIASWIIDKNIDGIIAHKGILEKLIYHGVTNKAFMLQLSGMSITDNNPNQKELLTSVEYACVIGADAISVQSNFDGENDRNNIKNMSIATEEAKKLGFPILAMIYNANQKGDEVKYMRHYLRIATELGVDAVKIPYYKDEEMFINIISDFVDDLDIFVAGGDLSHEEDLFSFVRFAASKGIAGVTFGRNVFQREKINKFLADIRGCLVEE
jgi:fructose-bisphosphate aldolase, class I